MNRVLLYVHRVNGEIEMLQQSKNAVVDEAFSRETLFGLMTATWKSFADSVLCKKYKKFCGLKYSSYLCKF